MHMTKVDLESFCINLLQNQRSNFEKVLLFLISLLKGFSSEGGSMGESEKFTPGNQNIVSEQHNNDTLIIYCDIDSRKNQYKNRQMQIQQSSDPLLYINSLTPPQDAVERLLKVLKVLKGEPMQISMSHLLSQSTSSLRKSNKSETNDQLSQSSSIINSNSGNSNTNQFPAITQDQWDIVIAKIDTIFGNLNATLAEIENYADFVVSRRTEIINMFIFRSEIIQSVSVLLILSIKQSLQTEPEERVEAVTVTLLNALVVVEPALEGVHTYQLFLSLVQLRLLHILKKTFKQIADSMNQFVAIFELIQKHVKNDKIQFKLIRKMLKIQALIFSCVSLEEVPGTFYDFIRNKNTALITKQPQTSIPKQTESKFYQILEKFGLVDPEYRTALLKTIAQFLQTGPQSDKIVDLFQVAICLMNKKIFLEYENLILNQLLKVKKKLSEQSNKIFNKIVETLIKDRDSDFLMTNRKQIMRMAINEEVSIIIFSVYYSKFMEPECPSYDIDIISNLTKINMKLGIIPAEKFVPELARVGLGKLTEQCQSMICNDKRPIWNRLAYKIMQQKCKTFLDNNLVNYEQFTTNSDVFCLYSNMFIQLILNVPVDKLKDSANLVIAANVETMRKIHEHAQVILQQATRMKIANVDFLWTFSLLLSLLQIVKSVDLESVEIISYFVSVLGGLSSKEVEKLLQQLEIVFNYCKNAFTLFLIVSCGVWINKNQGLSQLRRKYTALLEKITKLINNEGYAKIMSYSRQNLKILMLLVYISNSDYFSRLCQELICAWVSLYNQSDVEFILYQFDTKLYSPFLELFQCDLSPREHKQKFITTTMSQINLMLKQPACVNSCYLSGINNSINFIPIRHATHKNSLTLQFKMLINSKVSCNSFIEIYGSPRSEITTLEKYRILFKNKKFVFYNRTTKEVECTLQDIGDEIYMKPFSFMLRFVNGKITVEINKTQLVCKQYNSLVDNIKFEMLGDILIKDFKWQRFDQEQTQLAFNSTFQVFPSEAEIKLTKTHSFSITNLQQKLDLFYLCVYLKEIAKINHSMLSLNQYYSLCCELILRKEGSIKDELTSEQLACVKELFDTIFRLAFEEDILLQIPERVIASVSNVNAKRYYYFIVICVVNTKFLGQATRENQLRVVNYLTQLLFGKKGEFSTHIQNKNMKILTGLANSITKNTEATIRQKYFELIQKIILNHENNPILLKKISFLFYLAYGTKSEHFKQFFERLIDAIFSVINHSDTAENHHIKKLGKYILLTHKNIELMFLMANIEIKTKILDHMIDDENLTIKCHRLFEELPGFEVLELSSWLIVYCKRTMFYFFDDKKRSHHNLLNLLFFIKETIKIYPIVTDEDHKQEILTMTLSFIKRSIKLLSQKPKQQIVEQIEQFFTYAPLIKLIAEKIVQFDQSEIKNKSEQVLLNDYFTSLFKSLPKCVIIKALQQLRKLPEIASQCCIYLLKQEYIMMLPERALSAFLQYLIQMLFFLKYEGEAQELSDLAEIICNWVLKIFKNYEKISTIPQPLLYSFPKMEKRTDISNTNNVQKLIKRVQEQPTYELRGGILFKLMCITFHLIQAMPQVDLSVLLTFFLQKIGEKNKSKNQANFRAVADFIQVSKQTKSRSAIDAATHFNIEKHQKYFEEQDQQLPTMLSSSIRRSTSKVDLDTDLTSFFIDYFFMKICLYLENKCDITEDPEVLKNCETYSKQILKALNQQKHIWEQMNEKNVESKINFETIQDLLKFNEKEEENLTISDMMNSPGITNRRLITEQGFRIQGFGDFERNQTDNAFLEVPQNRTPPVKRRSTISFDLTSGKKKKKDLLVSIEQSIFTWSDEAKKRKMHRFFRVQSKQILFYELLHQVFVISSTIKTFKQVHISKGKRLINFLKDQGNQFLQNDKIDENWKNIRKQIRRVYRFTCEFNPQLKLKRRQFPNLTFPLTAFNRGRTQVLLQSPSQNFMINPDFIFTILHKQLESPGLNLNTIVCLDNEEEQQKIIQTGNYCQISNPKGVYFCEWEMESTKIVFTTKSQKSAKSKANQRILKYGSPICNILQEEGKIIQLDPTNILEIFFRKFNQVKNSSVEFFLRNGLSIYIIFYTQQKTKSFLQECRKKFPRFKNIKIVENYRNIFASEGYTEKWVNGELSNFDYLMLINKYAGRTYCDLNQYYIFPWILEDYTSTYLDISSSKTYRDLKKPIGALRQQKFEKYQQKLGTAHSEICEQYLYGSHYSTSLFIYYYLVRLEPFTTLHKDMQGGDFDAPDRLFSSMEQMWECLMSESSTSDIKESIPQFYYLPTFLKNINELNLGKKQSNEEVSDVKLPPWAESPTDFILKMRACLQSDYVSSNLNHWIDLIFGKDQKSMQKNNVFHPLSYVENVNPEKIQFENLDAIMSQISFFGQNPNTLFTREHPRKKSKLTSINANNLSLYASQDFSLVRESTTSASSSPIPAKIYEEQNLDVIFYVSKMYFHSRNMAVLKISGISKNVPIRTIELDMQNTIHSLVRTVQKIEKPQTENNLKRLLSQNNIEFPQQKVATSIEIGNLCELSLNLGVKDKTQIVKKLKLNYKFKNIRFNQIVFVAYGMLGLRVYNWNEQLVWECNNEGGQISQCYLQPELMFFTTSNGKLFVYDFFRSAKELVFEYIKPTNSVDMLVFPQKRFVTKRNEISFKFLLVADGRKIIFLHYSHKKNKFPIKFN